MGLAFTLTPQDIVVPTHCPVLGLALERGRFQSQDASPTLDRLLSDEGYVPGNVIVMSSRANRIKGNASSSDVLRVGRWMQDHGL